MAKTGDFLVAMECAAIRVRAMAGNLAVPVL